MRLPLLLLTQLFIVVASDKQSPSVAPDKEPRSLINFNYMIKNYLLIDPLKLVGYGNYCGLGGSGVPIDDLDRCCQTHDNCYGTVQGCSTHFQPYILHIESNQIDCGDRRNNDCQLNLCLCDKTAVLCFGQHRNLIPKRRSLDFFFMKKWKQ